MLIIVCKLAHIKDLTLFYYFEMKLYKRTYTLTLKFANVKKQHHVVLLIMLCSDNKYMQGPLGRSHVENATPSLHNLTFSSHHIRYSSLAGRSNVGHQVMKHKKFIAPSRYWNFTKGLVGDNWLFGCAYLG